MNDVYCALVPLDCFYLFWICCKIFTVVVLSIFHTQRQTEVLFYVLTSTPLSCYLHLKLLQVGTIVLLAMTGSLIFLFFFLAATLNAIIISLLVSLAAVGGFLALFFACVTAIYVGALGVALFVISTATISAIVAVVIAAGTNNIHFSKSRFLKTS